MPNSKYIANDSANMMTPTGALDKHDSQALYKVLLEEVLPTYQNNKAKWEKMMQASINQTKEQFGVKRMLDEYYELLY